MKAAFHTLGCKVNQYETEGLKEIFKSKGYDIVCDTEYADVYVINTCSVTNLADRKSRQFIRRARGINPDAVVAVTGCYAQMSPDEVSAIEGVDIVTGTNRKSDVAAYVEEFIDNREKRRSISPYEDLVGFEEIGPVKSMESRTRAYIKVEEGCDRFCSYCIIPYARGKVRSRAPEEVIREAEFLVKAGFKELILTGINTALYGTEEDFKYEIHDDSGEKLYGIEILIYLLEKMEGEFRIRLSSLEPTAVNSSYVKRLLKYSRLCHHLHLSAQSGSTEIIKAMNRSYTRDEYLDIVRVLRESDMFYGITTDIIVGFPGETDKDFEDSLNLVSEAEFLKVHAFQYSKRKGTKALEMNGHLSPQIKKERSGKLIKKADDVSSMFLEKQKGQIRKVLFEEYLEDCDMITGYTDNYIRVYVKGNNEKINTLCDVVLSGPFEEGLLGNII